MEDEAQTPLQDDQVEQTETRKAASWPQFEDEDDEGYGVISGIGPITRSEKPPTQPPFECPICDSIIDQKNALKHMLDQHKSSHALNQYETCVICGGLFIRHKLTPHVRKMHPGSPTGLAARGTPLDRPDRVRRDNTQQVGQLGQGAKPGKNTSAKGTKPGGGQTSQSPKGGKPVKGFKQGPKQGPKQGQGGKQGGRPSRGKS